jgi:hypothetical protein
LPELYDRPLSPVKKAKRLFLGIFLRSSHGRALGLFDTRATLRASDFHFTLGIMSGGGSAGVRLKDLDIEASRTNAESLIRKFSRYIFSRIGKIRHFGLGLQKG